MIEESLRTFCDSKYRWLIVIFGTLGLGCAILLPLVDSYSTECNEIERLSNELDEANQVALSLDRFEERVTELVAQLEEMENRTLTEDRHTEFRRRLQELARKSGCTMRRLQMGDATSRSWFENDSPLALSADKAKAKKPTPYVLQRWPISLSLDGPMANMHDMLKKMRTENMIVHAKNMELYPEGRGRKNVKLDMELWFFALERKS